jgi:hypothetical protein
LRHQLECGGCNAVVVVLSNYEVVHVHELLYSSSTMSW